jgi:hypothetical protein
MRLILILIFICSFALKTNALEASHVDKKEHMSCCKSKKIVNYDQSKEQNKECQNDFCKLDCHRLHCFHLIVNRPDNNKLVLSNLESLDFDFKARFLPTHYHFQIIRPPIS